MSWKQFDFKCRFFLKKIHDGLTLEQVNQSFEQSDLETLYSEKKLSGIQKELFDKLFHLSSSNDVKRTLTVFSAINLAENLTSSNVYKNIINKLAYLETITVTFAAFITIYKLYVHPAFFDLINQYPGLGDASFELIPAMWLAGLFISATTLVFALSYRRHIKNIDTVIINSPNWPVRFLFPKKAINEMAKLNKIITAPLEQNKVNDAFDTKMALITQMGLDESVELRALFIHHSEKLESIMLSHAKRILSFMYTVVVLGIGFYIMQIYDPIFKLGAIIE